jgi:hypothetical protein
MVLRRGGEKIPRQQTKRRHSRMGSSSLAITSIVLSYHLFRTETSRLRCGILLEYSEGVIPDRLARMDMATVGEVGEAAVGEEGLTVGDLMVYRLENGGEVMLCRKASGTAVVEVVAVDEDEEGIGDDLLYEDRESAG